MPAGLPVKAVNMANQTIRPIHLSVIISVFILSAMPFTNILLSKRDLIFNALIYQKIGMQR